MKQSMRLQEFISDDALRSKSHLQLIEYLLVLQPTQALWDEISIIKEKYKTDFSV